MCGICGFAGKKDDLLLERMCNSIIHRGPDSGGRYIEENASLGIRRLSIIDLNTGDQPIYNEDRSMVIVFNGEIYNYRELREGLQQKHSFYTNTDTEAILHLYEDYGESCVEHLRGMFAFAIWDKKARKLFISRDRVGEKPLYYTFKNGRFVFASELKALLEDKTISRDINLKALDYYLGFLYIPAPLSIFKDIHKLPAGHNLVCQDGGLKIERYWGLSFERRKNLSQDNLLDETRDRIQESVKMRLVSDVPLGVFLSGGIDSSIITAMMRRITNSEIDTFSIGFEKKYGSYNELEYSRIISRHFNTTHKEFIVKPEIVRLMPNIVLYLDEPFADSSAILTYLISREARKFVTVALSGIGGDEIFGGYPRYAGAELSLCYQRLPYFLLRGFSYFFASKNSRGIFSRFFKGGVLNPEERYRSWISIFTDELKEDLYTDSLKNELEKDRSNIYRDYFNNCPAKDYLNRIFYLDVNTYLADDLLFAADRMSMANSLEMRAPFCDHKLVEFFASLPPGLKIKNLKLKALVKESFRGILPEEILRKKKQGFMVPIGEWFREDLRSYIQEVLSEGVLKKRGYFNPVFVSRMLNEHFHGRGVYTHQIWALFILELWFNNLDK